MHPLYKMHANRTKCEACVRVTWKENLKQHKQRAPQHTQSPWYWNVFLQKCRKPIQCQANVCITSCTCNSINATANSLAKHCFFYSLSFCTALNSPFKTWKPESTMWFRFSLIWKNWFFCSSSSCVYVCMRLMLFYFASSSLRFSSPFYGKQYTQQLTSM